MLRKNTYNMIAICAIKYDIWSLCINLGDAIIEKSNDEILNTAIIKVMTHDYINTIIIMENGEKRVRKVFNNGYIWPSDFRIRLSNVIQIFKNNYGTNIFMYEPYYYVGNEIIKDAPLEINIHTVKKLTNVIGASIYLIPNCI